MTASRSEIVNTHRGGRAVWLIVAFALLLRVAVIASEFSELNTDRDAYLGIARNVWSGNGFATPGSTEPTAFRPPLYPLLLSVTYGPAGTAGTIGLQLVAGMLCVYGTICCGRRLVSEKAGLLAGAIIACDPLLLKYTAQPMTEVTCAALVIWLVWAWTGLEREFRWRRLLATGGLLGMAALCRPSLLPVPITLIGLVVLGGGLMQIAELFRTQLSRPSARDSPKMKTVAVSISVLGLCLITMLPWGIRNAVVLGRFKLTTTHGGYTLLLGNNDTFHDAVVSQPWGTTWGDYAETDPLSQPSWLSHVKSELDRQNLHSEFDRDQMLFQNGLSWIQQHPGKFLQASWLRQLRLWNPFPLVGSSSRFAVWAGLVSGLIYLAIYAGSIYGLVLALRSARGRRAWLPGLAVLLTIAVVHLFFWTNARMRAPLMPILAVWASAAVFRRGDSELIERGPLVANESDSSNSI